MTESSCSLFLSRDWSHVTFFPLLYCRYILLRPAHESGNMTSIAPSKWSMSVRSDDRVLLKLKLHVRRYYYILALPVIALYSEATSLPDLTSF